MKILESNDDTLIFERAFVARDESGELVPRCFFSGIACQLGEKPGPAADGIVACWPLDVSLQDTWPISVTVQRDPDLPSEILANFTANPQAVAAVRKFLEEQEAGRAHPGMLLL